MVLLSAVSWRPRVWSFKTIYSTAYQPYDHAFTFVAITIGRICCSVPAHHRFSLSLYSYSLAGLYASEPSRDIILRKSVNFKVCRVPNKINNMGIVV